MSHILLARCEETSKIDHFETHKLIFFSISERAIFTGRVRGRVDGYMQQYRGPPSLFLEVITLNSFDWLFGIGLMTWKKSHSTWKIEIFWVFGTRVYAEGGRGPIDAWMQQYRTPPSLSLCRPWPLFPSIGSVPWSPSWSRCQISQWKSHFYACLSSSIREQKREIPVLSRSTCWDFGVLRVDRRRDDQSSSNPETRVRKYYGCVHVLSRWIFAKIDGNCR